MEKEIQIRHGKEHFPNYVWWITPFEWQRNLNHYFASCFPPLKDTEENMFLAFQRDLHRVFCEMFNNRQLLTPFFLGKRTEPYIDIRESDKEYVVNADVPGVASENLHLCFAEDSLIIRGKRDVIKKDGTHIIHKECCNANFERVVALPEDADIKNSAAELVHNVLTVRIPRKGSAKKSIGANDYSARKEAS